MATRLGTALLKLAEDVPSRQAEIEAKVVALDKTILVTGRRGTGIRLLGAWRTCLVLYTSLTGREYTGK